MYLSHIIPNFGRKGCKGSTMFYLYTNSKLRSKGNKGSKISRTIHKAIHISKVSAAIGMKAAMVAALSIRYIHTPKSIRNIRSKGADNNRVI